MKHLFLFLITMFCLLNAKGQDQLLNVAKQYLSAGDFEKAASTFKQLVEYNPKDDQILKGYLQSLYGLKDFSSAEKILKTKLKADKKNTLYQYELAKVYKEEGETKKSEKLFNSIIDDLKPETVVAVSTQFTKDGYFDYAIKSYEKGKSFEKNLPYLYAEELALLYNKKGDEDKAIESLLDLYASEPSKSEDVKATLQRLSDKPEKFDALKIRILKRINAHEDMIVYPDLLAWLYIQQGDYAGAFTQIKAIDTRMNEQGRRVIGFGRVCLREKKFDTAIEAYNFVIEKGKDQPYYLNARSEKLTTLKTQLQNNPKYTSQDVENIGKEYADFLEENPTYKQKETLREYAELEARYANDVNKAIELLSEITKANNIDRSFRGRCKLEMGDYELVRNNIWESTLLYSQVDKEFKQDMLGEEARYRNAKLSYYTGDFSWAQGQLDVLKASTSELIANDALNLSVLITENNPPADSNTTPLLMFARADLLEFQNKDQDALTTLDSIETEFPKHPLMDDILMVRARIAYKKHDFSEAALQLQKIVTKYGDDVLADDAIYNLAMINEDFFNNKDEAKRLYEELILKYPGSTFVNEARKRFRLLRGDKPDVEAPKPF